MFSQDSPSIRQSSDSVLMTPATPGFAPRFPTFQAMWMPDWTQFLNSHPEMGTSTDLTFIPNFGPNPFSEAFKNGFGNSVAKLPMTTTISPTSSRLGGRRTKDEAGLSPEEIEKRTKRRERNKEAAARCRQRRLDHTEDLVQNIQSLQKENFQKKKEQLIIRARMKSLIDVISKNCLSHLPPHDKEIVLNVINICREFENEEVKPVISEFKTVKEEFERPGYLALPQLPVMNPWYLPDNYADFGVQKDPLDLHNGLTPQSPSSFGHVHDLSLA